MVFESVHWESFHIKMIGVQLLVIIKYFKICKFIKTQKLIINT